MTDYEAQARAAELRGKAEAARLRARALEEEAAELSGEKQRQRERELENQRYIDREVAAGRMCPGGCDTAVGGCIRHSDGC